MKWIEAYATGVQRIDEHHKMIFKTAEDFRAALDSGQGERTYGLLLEYLEQYCRGHFDYEERCMDEYHCPVANRNQKAHVGFVEVLHGFRDRYRAHGYKAPEARALVDAVDRWLDRHICRIDVQLRDAVSQSPSRGAGSSA